MRSTGDVHIPTVIFFCLQNIGQFVAKTETPLELSEIPVKPVLPGHECLLIKIMARW